MSSIRSSHTASALALALLHTAAALVLALLLAACGGGGGGSQAPVPPPPATVQSIAISPASPSLNVGMTLDLTALASYSNGTSGSVDNSSDWASSVPSVASVNAMGVVTALNAGSTTVTAIKDGKTGTAAVTVTAASATLTSITLNPASGTRSVGQTMDITATANWSNGTSTVPYDSNVAWASSNNGVATVNAGGVVTAVAAGNATITASASGITASASFTATGGAAALTGLTMLQSTSSLQVGQTTGVAVMAHWSDGSTTNPYTNGVAWASSNSAVATATPNATGCTVTAVSAGTVNITATASGYTATAGFGVSAPTPTFDARLVGSWRFIDALGEYGSFYTFNANGTFTYSLVYINRSGCISHSQIVASHQGTFSTQGSLDNPASAGQIIFTCTSHTTDWTNCTGTTTRTPWTGANPHVHWAAFINATTLATNHSDDFQATGTLNHAKQ